MFVLNFGRRRWWPFALASLIALAAAGCGSGSASGGGSGGGGGASSGSASSGAKLTVADVAPFTGADAALGPTYLVVVRRRDQRDQQRRRRAGHKLNCKSVDTRGDPADAVPAVRQMYASTSNLALVIGCTSDEAASVVPIITANKTVSFCMTGQSEFDHVKFPYFYRLVPPTCRVLRDGRDRQHQRHYKRVALAFGNDIGSQTFVAARDRRDQEGGRDARRQRDARPQGDHVPHRGGEDRGRHPDVILTEALGPRRGGVPVRGQAAERRQARSRDRHLGDDLARLVQVGLGGGRRELAVANFSPTTSSSTRAAPRIKAFSKAIFAEKGKVGNTGTSDTYLTAPGAVHLYDGINLAALAMVAAKSTIPRCTSPTSRRSATARLARPSCTPSRRAPRRSSRARRSATWAPAARRSSTRTTSRPGIFQIDTYTPRAGQGRRQHPDRPAPRPWICET